MNVRSTVSILAIVSTELSIKIANGVDAGGQGYRNLFAQTGMRTDKSYTNFQTKARKHNAGRFTETNSSPPAAANSLTRVRFIRRKRSLIRLGADGTQYVPVLRWWGAATGRAA
jgi:hypothetical protein